MSEPGKYLFVLSPSYSGSTLLTILLAGHSQISTLGELPGRRVNYTGNKGDHCSCGKRLTDCPVIGRFSERFSEETGIEYNPLLPPTALTGGNTLFRRTIDYPVRKEASRRILSSLLSILPGYRAGYRRKTDLSRTAADIFMKMTDTTVFLDSSKKAIRAHCFNRFYPCSTYLAFITRDGRATALSTMRNLGVKSVRQAGRIWQNSMKTRLRFYYSIPENRRIMVKYEDLCTDPTVTLAPVFHMLGLSQEKLSKTIDPSQMHLTGNRMSRKGRQDVSLNQSWKTKLTAQQILTFDKHYSELNSAIGY